MSTHFYRWDKNNLILHIHLQPNTKADEIVGVVDNFLKIKIQAPPIEDKANNRLIKFLSKKFGVTIANVEIIKGKHSKQKTILIKSPKNLDCMPKTKN